MDSNSVIAGDAGVVKNGYGDVVLVNSERRL